MLIPLDRKEATKYGMQHFVITGDEVHIKGNGNVSRHLRVGVAATDIDKAIKAVRLAHPNCKIYSVQHQGPIEIMVSE